MQPWGSYSKSDADAAKQHTWSCRQAHARRTDPDTAHQCCKSTADTITELTWSRLQARARRKGPDAHHVQACLLRKCEELLHWVVLASLVLADHVLCSLVEVGPAAGSAAAVSLVKQSGIVTARVRPLI